MRKAIIFQLMRFGIVGLTGAMLHFCIVVLLVQAIHMQPLIANIFGFAFSFQISYWGHRLWTFGHTVVVHRIAVPKLLAVQLVNFSANESLFFLFLTLHLPYPIALLIVLTILPIFTFIASKFWVFK